jgi:hypothetical protein
MISFLSFSGAPAFANMAYFFGSGGVQTARAGSLDHGSGAFQGYTNPGFAASAPRAFAISLVFQKSQFESLKNIQLSHPRFPHVRVLPAQGDYGFSHPFLAGMQLSLGLPVFKILEKNRFSFHFSGFVPFAETLQLSTPSTYLPSYVFYEHRHHHPEGHFALSLMAIRDVWGLGGGMSLTMRALSDVSLTLGPDASMVVTQSEVKVVPGFGWFGGTYFRFGSWVHISGVVYGPESWDLNLSATSDAAVWENTRLGIQMLGLSQFNYLPWRVELAVSADMLSNLILTLQLGWHAWSGYVSHRMQVELPGSGVPRQSLVVLTNNIWVPRAAVQWIPLSFLRLHSGVAYFPTMIRNLQSNHNDLDTDRILAGLGAELRVQNFLASPDLNFWWGVFGQMHFLIPKKVIKEDPASIGYPGYTLSGSAWAFSTQVSFDL